jgi:hypothetical protein
VAVLDEHVGVARPDPERDVRRELRKLDQQIAADVQIAVVEIDAQMRPDRERRLRPGDRAVGQEG